MFNSSIKPTFKLSENFLNEYRGQQPNWGYDDLSYFTYKRTYARIKDDGTQEEFVDTLERVVNGCYKAQEKHCKSQGLTWNGHKAQRSAQEMFRRMWNFKFLPPGRGLWMMGTDHVNRIGSAALNNCGFISTEDINVELGSPFAWAMDMLMLGVGIGFDTKGAGNVKLHKPNGNETIFTVPDSREGWITSVRDLINSYHKGNHVLRFDYSKIRPAGLPIQGFGGSSSGPAPLKDCHDSIRNILEKLDGKEITSVAIVDIFNFIGKCVVAGNVRRSAEIAIGELEDTDYVNMKSYDLHKDELLDRRWASNNSVFVDRFSDFSKVANGFVHNGEPGLIFLDNARHYGRVKDGWLPETDRRYDHVMGFNPCGEQQLESYELCCLVETFPANHEDVEDYMRTLKFAYLYAKSVTLIPTHDERTNSVMLRNRRIGCSMSGIQQAINKYGRQVFMNKFCDEGYQVVKSWDISYSRWLGVPESNRITTVKPSGTVSILAGAWPGVHFTHSEAYWRTVRVAASSPYVEKLLNANFRIEYSVTDWEKLQLALKVIYPEQKWNKKEVQALCSKPLQNISTEGMHNETVRERFGKLGGSIVVYFPVVEESFNKGKADVTIWEQLATVREMQYFWSDNAVSCTVTVKPEEGDDILPAIETVAPFVKTLSFLPLDNTTYDQMPYQAASVTDILAYKESLGKLDLSGQKEKQIAGSKFCDGDVCEINF